MPWGRLALPGGLLPWWVTVLAGSAQQCRSCSALECVNHCSTQKKFLGGAEGKQAVLSPSSWPLSLRLRPQSQARDLQGNSPAKGRSRSLGLGILQLGWGDHGSAFPPCSPSGRCLVSHASGQDRAHMQKQLPDLSFLKGAVVPFAAGRAGWTGTACVHSATPAASSPKGIAPPESPLGLCSAPVPQRWLAQTLMRSFWVPSLSLQPTPKKVPPSKPCWKASWKALPRGRQLLTHSASLGTKFQLGTWLTSIITGDGGCGFTRWMHEPGWKTGGIWRIPSPEDSSSCKLGHRQ